MTYDTLTESEWAELQRVWDLIEDGALEDASEALGRLAKRRGNHPDVRIVEAVLALELQQPEQALKRLEGAERSADPAFFFHVRASASYQLARFAEAREDVEREIAIRDDVPESYDLLSRIWDHLGDAERSHEYAEAAAELDSDAFPLPLTVSDDEFDEIVARSVAELPERVRAQLDETPIVVQPLPAAAVIQEEGGALSPDLLGLFAGRDLMRRSHADIPTVPGMIHLYRRNLLRMCRSREELAEEIRTTVLHEVAHLLGLDEDEVGDWGLA